jgi:hypothetical protein
MLLLLLPLLLLLLLTHAGKPLEAYIFMGPVYYQKLTPALLLLLLLLLLLSFYYACRRAPRGLHLHGPRVLPEAEAHGAGQDACTSQGATRGADTPTH